jgi:hypothetical protein
MLDILKEEKGAGIPEYDTQAGTILTGLIKVNQCDIRRDPVGLLSARPEDGRPLISC